MDNNLSILCMDFPFHIPTEKGDSRIILQMNLSDSSAHFFNPEADIKDRRLYKSYLSYRVIEQWYNEDTEDVEEEVLLDIPFDECSAIVDYSLGKQLEKFNNDYTNYSFFLRPLGDGVTWYFKKEFYPDYFSSKVTEELEEQIYEGKAHYPLKENIQMTMRKDRNGCAYMFDFSKTKFEAFIDFLIDVEDYFYNHPEPI